MDLKTVGIMEFKTGDIDLEHYNAQAGKKGKSESMFYDLFKTRKWFPKITDYKEMSNQWII